MTLATRCTSCGTTFRVVQDQLRVSEGWVRCGRCGEVFSALETLDELPETESFAVSERGPDFADTVVPQAWRDDPEPPSKPAAAAQAPAGREGSEVLLDPPADERAAPPDAYLAAEDVRNWTGPQTDAAPLPEADAAAPAAASLREQGPIGEIPAFVREADPASGAGTASRWWVTLAVVLALLVLAGQALYAWRDAIAARVPALHPALASACEALGCQVSAWRQLEGLSVESSNLGQVGSTTIYQLSVVLRNRTRFELMPPALDLSLTDSQGRIVARRVLSMTELGATERPLPAGGELALQARLSTGDRRITGYSLEIFHP